MNTLDKLIEIFADLSQTKEISPKTKLSEDLSLDSLCMVTLLIEIEDKFNIILDESDMNPFNLITVQDVIELVGKYIGDQNEENC